MFIATTALLKLRKLQKRIRGVAGGTSASKTISIVQILIDAAQNDKPGEVTSITSESMPHLKRGAIRDFLNIMMEHEYFNESCWNKTDFIYTFPGAGTLEFFSCDMPYKVRGPRRKRLFINEANNIPLETFDQLEVRTEQEIWLDWNPTSEFWFYTNVLPNRTDVDFITLTYKDNEGLSPNIIASIEARKANKNWWRVYGEGKIGESEGRIYTGWKIVDSVPHEARLERRGLDFGYSTDPTAIVAIYYYNGGYIVDEEIYQKGMSNKDISDAINNLVDRQTLVVADSAEPKSIDEMKAYGVNIIPVVKGKDSIRQGIQYVQDQKISVTKRSINLLKEYRGYMWLTDKEGRHVNDPQDFMNHALDALRYGFDAMRTIYGENLNTRQVRETVTSVMDLIRGI